MSKPVPPFRTPIAEQGGLVVADPWQKYFVNLYREGIWRPVIGGSTGTSGQSYFFQAGRFVKQGRLVTVTGHVALSALGTITGNVVISGFPFRSERHAAGWPWWIMASTYSNLATVWSEIMVLVQPNAIVASVGGIVGGGSSGGTQLLVPGDLTNSSAFLFSGSYLAQE